MIIITKVLFDAPQRVPATAIVDVAAAAAAATAAMVVLVVAQ